MKKDERWWGACGTAIYLGGWILVVAARHEEFFSLDLNELGDFLAGSFGPLAFAWLILGYIQQGKELKLSSEALQLQAQELKNSVDAQRELVAVSRDQVHAELERATEERHSRAKLIRPFFVGGGAGGRHAGEKHQLQFAIKNFGAPVSQVHFEFDGDMAQCTKSVDAIDKSAHVDFIFNFIGTGEGLAATVHITYRDADFTQGDAQLNLRVDTSDQHPRLVIN